MKKDNVVKTRKEKKIGKKVRRWKRREKGGSIFPLFLFFLKKKKMGS